METTKKRRGVGAAIVSALLALAAAALLELGRHTVLGWVLCAAVFCAFCFARRALKGSRRMLRAALWPALLVLLCAALAVSRPPYRSVPAVAGETGGVTEPVTVAEGTLTGVRTPDGAVAVYAGIPYAAPPVGENRWRPPQPARPWTGVRACDTFAPRSMQPENILFSSLASIAVYHDFRWFSTADNWREPRSEDSLYLNIWQPAAAAAGAKKPVLVYIHGGSLTTGGTADPNVDGAEMARQGVVVVSLAYRLGVFGYYAAEDLRAADGTTGNYGLLDQIAALRWVRENIAAFGGDPEQITICGESAGASSVNALCVSPLSEGLFRRAIAESSGLTARVPYHTFRPLEKALETGAKIRAEFSCADSAALRGVAAEKLVNTRYKNDAMTVDGLAIAEQPYLTYARGANHEEALLSGFNAREADVFNLTKRVDERDYVETLRGVLGDRAEEAAAAFPPRPVDKAVRIPVAELGGSAKGSADAVYSAAWFTYSHDRWSRYLAALGRPCWEYCFAKENGAMGANHAGELPYVFGNVRADGRRYDAADEALSRVMLGCWVNFVKTGDPDPDRALGWTQYADAPETVMTFGTDVGMAPDPFRALYPLIDAYQDRLNP